jgi:High potential iron-sulfur protein
MTERSQVQSTGLSRRTVIFRSVGGVAGATVLLLAQPRIAAAKMAPASASYQETPKGDQQCSNCTLFQASTKTCTLVDGTISPSGWCKFWVKKVG